MLFKKMENLMAQMAIFSAKKQEIPEYIFMILLQKEVEGEDVVTSLTAFCGGFYFDVYKSFLKKKAVSLKMMLNYNQNEFFQRDFDNIITSPSWRHKRDRETLSASLVRRLPPQKKEEDAGFQRFMKKATTAQ